MTKDIALLTDDEFEREIIESQEHAELDPDDPMYAEFDQLSTHISNLSQTLSNAQRRIFPYLRGGTPNIEIAERVGVSAQTVSNTRSNPTVRRMLNLLNRVHLIQQGPTESQRLYMLWDIAKRNRMKKPTVSIRAIDVINRQTRVYADEGDKTGDTVVNIQNFTVNTNRADIHDKINKIKDITPDKTADDTFKPITVTTPDAPTAPTDPTDA